MMALNLQQTALADGTASQKLAAHKPFSQFEYGTIYCF